MKKYIFVCIVAVSVAGFCEADLVQWSADNGGNGHWYEAVSVEGGINWTDARDAAISKGGYLATITSWQEQQFINDYVLPSISDPDPSHIDSYRIGGYQPAGSPEPDGNWQWVTGEPFVYTNWYYLEPNNNGDENTIVLWYGHTWNDYPDIATTTVGYIVEVPEPATLLLLGLGGLALRRKK